MKSMRAVVWFWAVAFLALPLWGQGYEIIGGRRVAAHEVLVKLRSGGSMRGDAYRIQEYDVSEARDLGRTGVTHLRSASKSAAQLIKELSADPGVLYAEPNYLVNAFEAPNDPLFPTQWSLENTGQNGGLPHADIDAVPAWNTTTGSVNNVVGVVDTGLDYTHPDLKGNVWSAPSAFTITFGPGDAITCPAGSHGYDAITNTCNPMDQNNHGTHVSGTIGASGNNSAGVAGVNWTASILGLRFLDASGNGTVANAVRVIEFALLLKAALPAAANIRVLSNSWGGSGFSETLLNAIDQANQAGILFVVAAGNDGADLDTEPSYPASYSAPNLVTVAATDDKDALASFSDYGVNSVDLGAPGVNIVSTIRGGAYALMSGTSMATPHVSGTAALVLSVCALGPADLKQLLRANADQVPALIGRTASGGRLNAYRAINACAGRTASPGFTLSAAPAALTLAPGTSVSSLLSLAPVGGFNGSVTLELSGLPPGVTATLTPSVLAVGSTATLKLTAAASAAAATTTLTVTAASGNLSNTAVLAVIVQPRPGFTLSATPSSATVKPGGAASYTISAASVGGFNGAVRIQLGATPPHSTVSFNPGATPGSLTMTVTTTKSTPTGTYSLAITGVSGQLTDAASVALIVSN
jgi:hypothetical protein